MTKNNDLIKTVADYYSDKLKTHGETPRGVDWNGEESQNIRFDQISKIVEFESSFSITDLGCGYGAYFDYLQNCYKNFNYTGLDVSNSMVEACNKRYIDETNANFTVSSSLDKKSDYVVASGIFNVRLKNSINEWENYIFNSIQNMYDKCNKGISFNCLTSYSDSNKMKDYLYYMDPCQVFDFCKRSLSTDVALLHDYKLYEFTILVRK